MNEHEKLITEVFWQFYNGHIAEGARLMESYGLDYLEIIPVDKWNWLHHLLVGIILGDDRPSIEAIKFFIEKGVPVNAQDVYKMTPLHYAMRGGYADGAIVLLEAGADPNIPDRDGLRPLSMVGYTADRLDVLELMLKKGANVHNLMGDATGRTILESWEADDSCPKWQKDIYETMKKYA
ncbi:ankyrin repeat domain-containing protein [Conchiformibius steedae]|uniref:ankyrin repeat domain-containing protein n=1 Tax=Conchiformibius steedae TaxID=153493 RepID=UPI00047D335D|nr:ankyrin repeat domain-containing protein [Conchiformibius steedae]QMT32621.1 ankyrin repeat domain-containing protein [Conchiformibius steedae]